MNAFYAADKFHGSILLESDRPQASDRTAMEDLSKQMEQLTAKLPDKWRISYWHDFSTGSKGFIIGGFLLLFAFTTILAISINLWQSNSELSAHSVKYRLVRQYYPEVSVWAERKYIQDPDSVRLEVEQLEAEQEALRLLEEVAKKKESEMLESEQKAEQIRKQRDERQRK